MTDQGDQLAVHSSFRDVLRALEREEDDWTPDAVWASRPASAAARGNPLVPRSERLPDMDSLDTEDDDEGAAGWWDRIARWSPAIVMAMAVPTMALLFFASDLGGPIGGADRDAAPQDVVSLDDPAGKLQLRDGVQAFASLGQRAFALGAGDLNQAVAGEQPATAQAAATTASSPTRPRSLSMGSEWVAVSAPVPGTQVLTIRDPGQTAADKPEWMQPWNRSALGGPR